MKPVLFAIAFTALAMPLAAQWQNYPTPGIPRTPDGKPNLSAPAPRTPDGKPDLSGVWTPRNGLKYFQDLSTDGIEIPMLPSAKALYEQRKRDLQKGPALDPPVDIPRNETHCLYFVIHERSSVLSV